MPIYEYLCVTCNRKSSVFVRSMSSDVRPVCAHCGSAEIQRAISGFAVHRGGPSGQQETSAAPPPTGFFSDPTMMASYTQFRADQEGLRLPSDLQGMIDASRSDGKPLPPASGDPNRPSTLVDL